MKVIRSLLAVVISLVVFVIVSFLVYLAALLVTDRLIWSLLIGAFCGFAAATLVNATDITARLTRRSRRNGVSGDADDAKNGYEDPRENGRVR